MKSLRNIIIILILIGIISAYFGPALWRSRFAEPRKTLADQKAALTAQIADGQNRIAQMNRVTSENMSLYARSFPTRQGSARIQYQIWLTQLAEFCGFKKTQVNVGNSSASGGIMTHVFRLRGDCSAEQLYRFLYEFYWTGYLHRIHSVNLQTRESTSLLDVTFLIEGLTMAKVNRNQPFPLTDALPGPTAYYRRLSSSPWGAYQPMARLNVFQFSRPGIDDADFTVLAAVPTALGADGRGVTQTRWNIETTDTTLVVEVGGRLSTGSFVGTVEEVIDDMVILKQANGFKWILGLGDRLSDAACIPGEF